MQWGLALFVAGPYHQKRQGYRYYRDMNFPDGTDFAPHARDLLLRAQKLVDRKLPYQIFE